MAFACCYKRHDTKGGEHGAGTAGVVGLEEETNPMGMEALLRGVVTAAR